MAKKETFTFLSKDGKTQIHCIKWTPEDGNYRAILQLTHGMVEYIDRYDAFANFMTTQGFLVVGNDHLGHGDSVVSKEDWGYFAPNPSDTLIEDMHTLRTMTQEEGKPYFMLGHSMGSFMLRKYLIHHADGVKGAIIMGTNVMPDQTVNLAMRIAKMQAGIFGWRHRSKLLQQLSYSKPYKRFDLTGKDTSNSWLTKDEEIVKAYYADPRCTFLFTDNAYLGMFEAILECCNKENAGKLPKDLPLFFVSGAMDPVGEFGKSVKQAAHLYMDAGMTDVTWKLYEDDRHEILNELDKETVYKDIAAWLAVHMEQ